LKSFCFIIPLIAIFSASRGQQWEWAIQENVQRFAVDPSGNIFTLNDSLIKKFNTNGVFQWKKQFTGDLLITGMAADNTGCLYFTGAFTDFRWDTSHFISSGNKDIFFCKIDPSGTLLWNHIIGGKQDEHVTDICLDKMQNVFICGVAGKSAIIGSKTFSETESFISRYDLSGNLELLIDHPGAEPWDISTDTSGNVYVLGGININDTLDFGNGFIFYGYGPGGYGSHFIAKFNDAGNIVWAKDLGGNYYQPHKNLGIDNNGSIYLTKWQRYSGFYLKKFSSAGNHLWSHDINGIYGDCHSLSIASNDSIWLAGSIWNNPFKGNPFIWKFDQANNLKESIPATTSASGSNIANDNSNNVYVSGTFTDTAVFGSTTLLAVNGNYFLAKISRSSTSIASANNISENQALIYIYPNPSTGYFSIRMNFSWKNTEVSIFSLSGKCIYREQVNTSENHPINLSAQPKGIYLIKISNAQENIVKKVIIQ